MTKIKSVSARRVMDCPGSETGLAKFKEPADATGTFMNRFKGDGTNSIVSPSSRSAPWKLSTQLE